MQNLLNELTVLLQQDERLAVGGKLLKNKIIELGLQLDRSLLKMLLSEPNIKKHFFQEAGTVLVFDKIKFQKFVNSKAFLPNSFTSFKNKIGLTADDEYITEGKEVVLSWPYKDCVLEGGQTKEEGKRDEIFWNETLAPDDIDRLLAPKVIHNFKKYGNNVGGGYTFSPADNLIIKGNNLLALHTLKAKFKNKIKLIYIDPPYNTGNDSFNYNDNFNHSTWLVFMKNRLEAAKQLLRDDGVIFVQCDDNEQAYLKVLMDGIFRKENFVGDLIRKTKSTTNDAKVGFNIQHENTLIFAKNKTQLLLRGEEKTFENYKNPDNDPKGEWTSSDPSAKNDCYYFEIKNPYTNKIDLPPKNRCWLFSEKRMAEFIAEGKIVFKKEHKPNERGFIFKRYKNEIRSDFNLLNSLAGVDNQYMNQAATKERNVLFGEVNFSYPKPENFIRIIIASSTEPDDIVLDYHLGSGTTAAVAHKMGRQYIGIEQMDYIETIAVERLKKVIDGEQGGISKTVNWQGGGSFVYCELAELNQKFVDRILKADSREELIAVMKEMKEKFAISYKFDKTYTNFDDIDSSSLELENLRKIAMESVDFNQLYVNYSEIEDKTFGFDKKIIALNRQFQGEQVYKL